MKKASKFLAPVLALALIACMVVPAFAAAQTGYTISNPYANVDWGTVNQYKAALHTHTTASDGKSTLRQSIERHVESDFDIIATTDHSTTNYSWINENYNFLVHTALNIFKGNLGLDYLGTSGSFNDGITYTLGANENNDEILTVNTTNFNNKVYGEGVLDTVVDKTVGNQKQILRVPYANEQNGLSANAHVTSWFADYNNMVPLATYNLAIRNVDRLGGLCVINHPGEYSKARYEIYSADAYNEESDIKQYKYFNNKCASLIDTYDACIGIDISSKGDSRTRFDRILWDNLLTRFSAAGKNVFGIASSDAHRLDAIDTGSVVALMKNLSSAELKNALKNGEFFAQSTCIGNPTELDQIAKALKDYYGVTDMYNEIKAVVNELENKAEQITDGDIDADEHLDTEYSFLNDEGYRKTATTPEITSINTNDAAQTITLNTKNALLVRWISNGTLVATSKASGGAATLNLKNYSGKLGNYVRAEVFGEGGIVYTQAFLLNQSENAKSGAVVVDKSFVDIGAIDCLVMMAGNWYDMIMRLVGDLF